MDASRMSKLYRLWICLSSAVGVSALTTRSVGIEGMINVPIAIDNVVIKPGDLVVADDDGIFVVDPEFAKEYGERAVAKQNGEPATKKPD